MKQLSKWHVLGFIILFIIYIVDTSKIINTYLYYKNGSHFDINYYRIKFPLSHWAYFGESKLAYIIAGQEINSKNLSAEFFKNSHTINIFKVISNCDTVSKHTYKTIGIQGNIYICKRATNETMYFFSDNKDIFIRETDYNSTDSEIVREYKLLLDSISKRR